MEANPCPSGASSICSFAVGPHLGGDFDAVDFVQAERRDLELTFFEPNGTDRVRFGLEQFQIGERAFIDGDSAEPARRIAAAPGDAQLRGLGRWHVLRRQRADQTRAENDRGAASANAKDAGRPCPIIARFVSEKGRRS